MRGANELFSLRLEQYFSSTSIQETRNSLASALEDHKHHDRLLRTTQLSYYRQHRCKVESEKCYQGIDEGTNFIRIDHPQLAAILSVAASPSCHRDLFRSLFLMKGTEGATFSKRFL